MPVIKNKKLIILITPMLQPYRITFYKKLSIALEEKFDLIIYHGTKEYEDGRPAYNGIIPFKEKGFRIKTYKVHPFKIVLNVGMYKTLKNQNPDLIIVQGIAGDMSLRLITRWAKRHNKRLIFWTCGWEPGIAKGIFLSLKNKYVASFFKRADSHLTYSSKASLYVEKMGVDKSIVETCYNGIETDNLIIASQTILERAKEIRKKYHLENGLTFIYVGGLIAEKRVELLLDAFIHLYEEYKNIKLIIIGDGPLRMIIEEKIKLQENPNIFYLGRIINDVDQFIAASDCLVLPGIGGLALNQAMFWGKTCIVSKADGTEDDLVIEGVTGYRFKENDIISLIYAMERRINEKKYNIDLMSEKSKELILNKSNVNNMTNIFKKTIERLLN